jgi:hypothetical protein
MFINLNNISSSNNIDINLINVNTFVNIKDIEHKIMTILDEFSEKCKYYINCTDNYFCVSFNVDTHDQNQYRAMCETSFYIKIFKNINDESIMEISNEINSHEEWIDIKKILTKIN